MDNGMLTTQPTSSEIIKTNNVDSPASNEIINSIANIGLFSKYQGIVAEKISAPFNVPTPKEKVKKRPDGFDYVEGTWMDHVSKEHMPLYKYTLLHISWNLGWINVVISLEDRITGNVELGAGAARIQVSRGVETPGFKDVIDMGNNLKAALTQAIKNAQSRFGVAADVYGKRESIPNDEEKKRFTDMFTLLNTISPAKAKLLKEQWEALGTDFSEFLDRWQVFVDKQSRGGTEVKKEKKSVNL